MEFLILKGYLIGMLQNEAKTRPPLHVSLNDFVTRSNNKEILQNIREGSDLAS